MEYNEIRKLCDDFVGTVKSKGKGVGSHDYARLILPTLVLKRILDMRGKLEFSKICDAPSDLFFGKIKDAVDSLDGSPSYVFKKLDFLKVIEEEKVLGISNLQKEFQNLKKYDFGELCSDILSDAYMYLLGEFSKNAGKDGGEFFTPTPLVKNAIEFLDLKNFLNGKESVSIADPTSGSNTFLTFCGDRIKQDFQEIDMEFYGQELKEFQFCLGLVNMFFHGNSEKYNIGIDLEKQNASVIDGYNDGIGQKRGALDIVVANPPYGTKNYGIEYAEASRSTDARWKFGVPSKQEGEYAFLMTIYDLLNREGKAVVVMPLGTLFRDGAKEIRRQLVEEDVVEGLVTLPGNMFLTTSIPVVLWILNKNKKNADKGKIFMVNASKDFKKVGKFNEWQAEKAVGHYLARTTEDDYSGYVDAETLEKNKYNFSVQRYFSKEQEKEEINIVELEKEIADLQVKLNQQKSEMDSIFSQILKLEENND